MSATAEKVRVEGTTVTVVLAAILKKVTGNRVTEMDEEFGLDLALHGETAYAFTETDASEGEPELAGARV